MGILLLLLHIAVCVMLIMVVLLQSGKAADLAGAFGGGGSQTALGSRGAATFLTKATTTCAVLFMITSLGLALVGSKKGASVLETLPGEAAAPIGEPPVDDAVVPLVPADDAAAGGTAADDDPQVGDAAGDPAAAVEGRGESQESGSAEELYEQQ